MKDNKFAGHTPFPELTPVPKNINEIQKAQREENEKNPRPKAKPGEKISEFPLPGDADYPGNENKGYSQYDSMVEYQKEAENNLSDPEVADAHEKIKAAIAEKSEETFLGKVRNIASTNAFRAAFLSVMLFAKVGQASAESFNNNNTEITLNSEKEPENFFQEISEGNYVAKTKEFIRIEAKNYFDTDKAEISKEAKAEIQANFNQFLDGINSDNFDDVMSKNWIIRGSSDERPTQNWNKSNTNLTIARIGTLHEVIKEAASQHKYEASQKLTEAQKSQITNKGIAKMVYPSGREGKEDGVTYVTDKLNPETGKNYTEDEVAKMKKDNPEEYQKILESCRFTNFETESTFFADAKNFSHIDFLIDESGSMAASKSFISNHLRSIEMNKQITLNVYSDQMNPEDVECVNNSEAADKILGLSTEGSFRERQVNSTLGLINKIAAEQEAKGGKEEKETHKIYVATDEAIQNTNSAIFELLQIKAAKVDADVEFLIGYSHWVGNDAQGYQKNEVMKLSLKDLSETVNKKREKEIARGINKNVKSQKIDDFCIQNYQSKKAEFTAYLANSYSTAFLKLLKSKGYGETAKEIADSLDQRLSGSGNYSKLNEIVNVEKIQEDYVRKLSGHGGDSQLAEAVFNSIRALRSMIEARNEMDVVVEAAKGLSEDEIPDIKDHIFINVINDVAPVILPVKGPTDLASNLW